MQSGPVWADSVAHTRIMPLPYRPNTVYFLLIHFYLLLLFFEPPAKGGLNPTHGKNATNVPERIICGMASSLPRQQQTTVVSCRDSSSISHSSSTMLPAEKTPRRLPMPRSSKCITPAVKNGFITPIQTVCLSKGDSTFNMEARVYIEIRVYNVYHLEETPSLYSYFNINPSLHMKSQLSI